MTFATHNNHTVGMSIVKMMSYQFLCRTAELTFALDWSCRTRPSLCNGPKMETSGLPFSL